MDLSTRYLGLELANPLVLAASSLSDKLDNLRRAEEAGAAAVVMHSLFEEQIEFEADETQRVYEQGTDQFAESLTYFPELEEYHLGPESYVRHVERAKQGLSVPVIASLNGTSKGGWIRYARVLQDAGADALELNIYLIAADITVSGPEVEAQYLDLVSAVTQSVSIPVAVKLGPYFSSPGHMCLRLAEAGADGLVLFNRFLQPDIDLEAMEISTQLSLSTSDELRLPLRWIAILFGRVSASLALTGGIHSAQDLIKAVAAGADIGMVASAVYQQGFGFIRRTLDEMRGWMAEREYQSLSQLKGSMSQQNCPDPAAFERGNYMKTLVSYTSQPA
ncbi:MAG TPA: dihydroorotate dehydrogenase-like protein [Planctomycetaceae bacterium]|nr:dihydroorotate dehydrogenase-like protein [Planctomycetaceae bacterium]HIQ20264.1 dihydroorotate dehydrogenase-like protein [Planctomycetota bacterium]